MAVKSKISRVLSVLLIEKFLKPEIIEENKSKKDFKFYSRETKILGDLYLEYPNEEFWKNINLGFFLNSSAFFKTQQGKDEIEKHWRLYILSKKLDIKSNSPTFDQNRVPEVSGVAKIQSTLDWVG